MGRASAISCSISSEYASSVLPFLVVWTCSYKLSFTSSKSILKSSLEGHLCRTLDKISQPSATYSCAFQYTSDTTYGSGGSKQTKSILILMTSLTRASGNGCCSSCLSTTLPPRDGSRVTSTLSTTKLTISRWS